MKSVLEEGGKHEIKRAGNLTKRMQISSSIQTHQIK